MQKTYNDIIGLNNTMAGMSRERWPFGMILAKNIKIMDKIIMEYNEKREKVIDLYAKRDEEGKILGVLRPLPAAEGVEPIMERVKEPTRIDDTEWTDRAALDGALAELNKQMTEIELIPVDVETPYFNMQANRDMKISQYLDANMEPSLVLYLEDYGFFKGLEL